jgi:hypothetical protein
MRKFLMSLFVFAGVVLVGTLPASATAATGLTAKPAITSTATADKVHFRRHGGIFLGFGGGYGGYPYYRRPYYNNYYYSNYPVRRHRHWCDRHDRWEY